MEPRHGDSMFYCRPSALATVGDVKERCRPCWHKADMGFRTERCPHLRGRADHGGQVRFARGVIPFVYSAACCATVGSVPATVARRISRGCD